MSLYLRAKFEFFSIILTSFRQSGGREAEFYSSHAQLKTNLLKALPD